MGLATFDIVLEVDHHPGADEKCFASHLLACGGGPAANAAVAIARLEGRSGFVGYLGKDVHGELHHQELRQEGVDTERVLRGDAPTPLSVILVKPDGRRTVVSHKVNTPLLPWDPARYLAVRPKTVLFDGHQPEMSVPLAHQCRHLGITTVLDAGSLHEGTIALLPLVDHAVVSTPFALAFSKATSVEQAMASLQDHAPCVVITQGERGLLWRKGAEAGRMRAFPVKPVDTTGAGDTFHGAFALSLARGCDFKAALKIAGAAAALCCLKLGARPGIPNRGEVAAFLKNHGTPET